MKLHKSIFHKIAILIVLAISPMFIQWKCPAMINKKELREMIKEALNEHNAENSSNDSFEELSITEQRWYIICEYWEDLECIEADEEFVSSYSNIKGVYYTLHCEPTQMVVVSGDGRQVFIFDKNEMKYIWYKRYERSSYDQSKASIASEATTKTLDRYPLDKFLKNIVGINH